MTPASYHGYGPRPRPPGGQLIRGVIRNPPDFVLGVFSELERRLGEPFLGVTVDGLVRPDLFSLNPRGPSTAPAARAARAYLDALEPEQRARATRPLEDPTRRWWINAFPTWEPAGLRLGDLEDRARTAALDLLSASLSARGFAEVRDAMRLNQALGELIEDDYDGTLREWTYWLTVFGEPTPDGPWGWQLMGHHIDLNCLCLADRMVLTPMFLGAEITHYDHGPYRGIELFGAERDHARELVQALSNTSRAKAVLHDSMHSQDLPLALRHPTEGRHRSVAGQDNLILTPEGVPGADLSVGQRERLLELVKVYIGRLPEGHSQLRIDEVRAHLEDTYFCWIGSTAGEGPFYYRIHSPVILVEFDNHSGVFLDNDEPEPFHVHTIVRTPNGGDYGIDLLRRHYDRSHRGADDRYSHQHVHELPSPEPHHHHHHQESPHP